MKVTGKRFWCWRNHKVPENGNGTGILTAVDYIAVVLQDWLSPINSNISIIKATELINQFAFELALMWHPALTVVLHFSFHNQFS